MEAPRTLHVTISEARADHVAPKQARRAATPALDIRVGGAVLGNKVAFRSALRAAVLALRIALRRALTLPKRLWWALCRTGSALIECLNALAVVVWVFGIVIEHTRGTFAPRCHDDGAHTLPAGGQSRQGRIGACFTRDTALGAAKRAHRTRHTGTLLQKSAHWTGHTLRSRLIQRAAGHTHAQRLPHLRSRKRTTQRTRCLSIAR